MSVHSMITNKRTFYEGAKKTKANQDFYNADNDFEATASADRATLRARARWLSANNAIMDNIDNSLMNNIIGDGIRLQMRSKNKRFNDDIELRWNNWCKRYADITGRFSFNTLQRVMLKNRMVDGEVFIIKHVVDKQLQLQLLEPDYLSNIVDNSDALKLTGSYVEGLEFDKFNRIVRYHFMDNFGRKFSYPANQVINYFIPERPTQYRGVSEYKQAILDIKNFSAFQSATIQAMRARANIAYVVKQEGALQQLGADRSTKLQSVNGVSAYYLRRGETIEKLDPDSPPSDYNSFSEHTIRSIATARKISYELAFRDYSRVNFASSRASLLQDFKRFDNEQSYLIEIVLDNIFEEWFELEVLSGRIKAPTYFKDKDAYRLKWLNRKWVTPKRDLVDPLKEITAIEKAIKLNLTTETKEASSRGEDYETIIQKKAEENALKEKYGIPLSNIAGVDYMEEEGLDPIGSDNNLTGSESKLEV